LVSKPILRIRCISIIRYVFVLETSDMDEKLKTYGHGTIDNGTGEGISGPNSAVDERHERHWPWRHALHAGGPVGGRLCTIYMQVHMTFREEPMNSSKEGPRKDLLTRLNSGEAATSMPVAAQRKLNKDVLPVK
jgi:hypothetical protein